MKKLAIVCVSLTLLSILFLLIWNGYNRAFQDRKVNTYSRFFTADEEGKSIFNWWGIISPIQTESQRKIIETKKFIDTVYYPCADNKFRLVRPSQGREKFIATEIARVINDSLNRVKVRNNFDYDGTSLAVRKYVNPRRQNLPRYSVYIHLFGTASPEAVKYGFRKSIQPGHIERENIDLAKARLNYTADILEKKYGFNVDKKSSTEIQFYNILTAERAVKNPKILDKMRYVVADVTILTTKLEVNTITAPLLFPIWVLLVILGLGSLLNWNHKTSRSSRRIPIGNLYEILGLLKLIIFTLGFAVLIMITIFFSVVISTIIAIILITVFTLLFLFFCCEKEVKWFFITIGRKLKKFFRFISEALKWLLLRIFISLALLVFLYLKTETWWKHKTKCQKINILLIAYSIISTGGALYFWLTCPC